MATNDQIFDKLDEISARQSIMGTTLASCVEGLNDLRTLVAGDGGRTRSIHDRLSSLEGPAALAVSLAPVKAARVSRIGQVLVGVLALFGTALGVASKAESCAPPPTPPVYVAQPATTKGP